jgi:hypothetical protein
MHRIEDTCAGYELDPDAPAAYIMIAVDPHIRPHNAEQWQQGGETDPSPPAPSFFVLVDRQSASPPIC